MKADLQVDNKYSMLCYHCIYRYYYSHGKDAKRHELRYLMNGAIRREERVNFRETTAGQRTSRWLDDIADLMGSKVGISSKRDVSISMFSLS